MPTSIGLGCALKIETNLCAPTRKCVSLNSWLLVHAKNEACSTCSLARKWFLASRMQNGRSKRQSRHRGDWHNLRNRLEREQVSHLQMLQNDGNSEDHFTMCQTYLRGINYVESPKAYGRREMTVIGAED